jgi:hypothetical protein
MTDADIEPGATYSCDESRAEDPPAAPHLSVDLWPDYPRFRAVVDGATDGVVTLTVSRSNSHPRSPDPGEKIDIGAETLCEDARWRRTA